MLLHGCTVPQLPTFTASLATATTHVTAAAATTSSRSRGRSCKRGGQGAVRGGGGFGGDVVSGGGGSAGAGGAPRAAAGDSTAAVGGGDTRLVGVWIKPSGETAVCVDGDTYAPLATFTVEPGFDLYTLHTGPRMQQQQQRLLPTAPVPAPRLVSASHQVAASPQVAVSSQVPRSGPVVSFCSYWSLAHPTVLWHHQMGHPSLPRLRAMSSQRLVLGLPRVLLSLPPSLAPLYGPCIEGRLRATPHSSSLRSATKPFETLHLDVWSPASCLGPKRERFFLVVVDDYSRYTTVFPLVKKSEVRRSPAEPLATCLSARGFTDSYLD
ncbi:unnamed protein product [Closterium sp. NIES-65]|nr:unnamed protein product [Closterium sp. NIES-65]